MSLDDEWQEYLRVVVPPEAGTTQISETRRAFHAGARALLRQLSLTERNPILCTVDPDELDTLQVELLAFNDAVRTGAA